MHDPVQEIVARLGSAKPTGKTQWQAKCPAHEDNKASLSLKRGEDGRALLHCHAGCTVEHICAALGVNVAALFPNRNGPPSKPRIAATYPYRDERGRMLYEVVRFDPKEFRQRRPNAKRGWDWNMNGVRRVPYRLPELIAAEKSAPVIISEGEKDADRLVQAGLVTTCNVGGAGKWKPEYSGYMRGRRVCIIADKDKAGRDHARKVAQSLVGTASEVRVLELPGENVKDAYDWFMAGGTAAQLLELVDGAPVFNREQRRDEREVATTRDADGGDGNETENEERFSQSQLLVKLAADVWFSHDGETAYATIQVEDHSENHPINGKAFRAWLARQFWLTFKKVPGAQAIQDALNVLSGKSQYEGEPRTAFVRVAEYESAIYLDLANEDWQIVKVTARGWELVHDAPVMFIRKRGMQPLPQPARGGSVNELRRFINVKDDHDFILIVACLVAALRGRGPFPVQAIYGEQGSCKSTAQRMQRALVDPNKSPLRSEPKEPRDLMIAASNSLFVAFDNLSNVPTWLSDALCRLSTGGGFSTRELYTDADEIIFDAMRPVMFNGITDVATRPDLLDRSVLVTLTPISETERKPEDELWRDFHQAQPRILGALLDAVAAGLANADSVKLDRLPRMADFAKWVTACEPGLEWERGTFMRAYVGNRATANESAIEGSAIGAPLVNLIEQRGAFTGTSKELMEELEDMLPKDKGGNAKLPTGWPKSPKAFSGELRRVAPNLRAAGINVTFGSRTRRGTTIILERLGAAPSPQSPPSPVLRDSVSRRDDRDNAGRQSSPASSPRKAGRQNGFDEGDESDSASPRRSGSENNGDVVAQGARERGAI
jgi:hypothetical protein